MISSYITAMQNTNMNVHPGLCNCAGRKRKWFQVGRVHQHASEHLNMP